LFPEEESFISHYERLYLDEKISSIDEGRFCSLPALVKGNKNLKIGITEADLFDYPCLFLEATGKASLKSKFPRVVLNVEKNSDRHIISTKDEAFIALTKGARTFPWRVFMISEDDARLVENQMVYLLSRDNQIKETSWIKPGLVAWDWWNDNNIFGVDFKSGFNTATYKYYIDFAAEYKIPYVILDEGWSKTTTNLIESNPDIDIPKLVNYGKERNVDLILWALWEPFDKDMENILDQFVRWGVKGLKVDFMTRSDQYMVNFYERTAAACAERELIVNFHGSFKPTGLTKTYPNILNYEGVKGLENVKRNRFITPEHDITICFTRMLAGPMDYTPGAMKNSNPGDFHPNYSNPECIGTRCHQLAMYIVYDAPLQMLSDSPSNYYKENDCTSFISRIKTVWDETIVLDARVSDYIVTARRYGDDWYIGALSDHEKRNLEIDFYFLSSGEYELEIMQDGVNADKSPNDYKHSFLEVNKNSKVPVEMAGGGGWAAICRKIR
jgi:alpha-glucosidase